MADIARLPSLTDAVEKVGDETGNASICAFADRLLTAPVGGAMRLLSRLTLNATNGQARHAADRFGGGRQILFASVLRFCVMAARWNSSRAPLRPRRRMRSKRW
jgi:hypothetical protein